MEKLAERKCKDCESTTLLSADDQKKLMAQLEGWKNVDGHHLEKEFSFKNFQQALDFTNDIGRIAESEGHHPDIYLTWGKVGLKIFTHSANGLTESDFVLAAKIDKGS